MAARYNFQQRMLFMLKRLIAASFLTLSLTVFAAAADDANSANKTLDGYLVDVACASGPHKTADWAAKHSKGCLNMDECKESGYAVVTAGDKVYKFDAKGNEEARKLIDSTDKKNDMKISVDGSVNDQAQTVAVNKIELQK
jgi:hypothetical protein